MSPHTIIDRPLKGKTDAMRLRQLLIDSYQQLGQEFNWEIRRWEGSFWCVSDAQVSDPTWGARTHLWETSEGLLIGAAVPDGPGDVALQVHLDYRGVEDAMLDWAEEHIAHPTEDGRRRVVAWAYAWDTERQERLARRGYAPKEDWFWHHRRRPANIPVPALPVAEGYTVRSVTPAESDVERWVACTNTVFGQSYTPERHRNFQRHSPSHNYDLHIVAEAPDGTFAAFAGLTVAAANRYGLFEPVGTHPDHRRKGLAAAVMHEAIRRVQALGTVDVLYVANWGTADAGKLYASVGMELYATEHAWVKVF